MNFAGNTSDFVIEEVEQSITFKLYVDGTMIVNEVYAAEEGRVRVRVKDIVDCFLSVRVPSSGEDHAVQSLAVKTFRAVIGSDEVEFTVVKGGISNTAESAEVFLRTQWLTLQPQTKPVMTHQLEYLSYYAGEACRVKVKAYFADGTAEVTLLEMEAGKLYTVDVCYLKVSGKFEQAVGAYDAWVENEAGQRLTYVQRYVLQAANRASNVYLFENTLGGLDTVVFTGKFTEKVQTEGTVTTMLEESVDSDIDLHFSREQNTGFVPTIEYARWLRGFFVSKQRYHVDGALRRIYLRESGNGFTSGSLNDFTFEFFYSKQTKYDVVVRNREDLPYLLEFPEVDSIPFLVPRLAEYPIAVVADDLMLPVQYAFENAWRRISVAAIVRAASEETVDKIDLSAYWKKTELVREGLYLKFLNQFLRAKESDDSVLWAGHDFDDWLDQAVRKGDEVEFKGVVADFFRTSTFAQGVDGFSVDERGRMFARSLLLFDFLETPELRYNKVTVVGDEQWRTTGGIIEEILDDGNGEDNKSRIKLKLEENEVNEFYEGDICKGIFHTGTGFKSVYFIVVSSMDEPNFQAGIMDVVLTGYMVAPLKAMTIARIGNVLYDEVDGKTVARYPERQRSSRVSTVRGNVQWYDHVDSWEITSKNIVMHYGEVKNAGLPGVPLEASGYSFWCNSVYIQNSVTYVDAEGEVIPEVTAVEPWEEGKTYTRNNQVSYLGCVYLCIAKSTTSIPRYDNPDWFMTAGNPNFVMELESSNGSRFVNDNIDTDIIASVFKYNQDITIDISKAQWTWTRESDYPDSDTIWNAQHVGFGNTLHLARTDFPESGVRKVTFACTAFLDEINSVTEKIKIR